MDVDKLLSGESQTVEYKAQRLPRSKSYARTVVAFANVRGGTLVFGVDDKTCELVVFLTGRSSRRWMPSRTPSWTRLSPR